MSDLFDNFQSGLESPPSRLTAIAPNDTADLPLFTRALNVASSGNVRVTTITGDEGVVYVAAGVPFPLRVRKVWQTGTDAVGIIGLS